MVRDKHGREGLKEKMLAYFTFCPEENCHQHMHIQSQIHPKTAGRLRMYVCMYVWSSHHVSAFEKLQTVEAIHVFTNVCGILSSLLFLQKPFSSDLKI